jgi:hypothetical protein
MPGVYLMPNGKVASVDLGDGRVSLVSRAKFEECCCPLCGLIRPDEILLESAFSSSRRYSDSSCSSLTFATEYRLKNPTILLYSPTPTRPCLWQRTGVAFESRSDNGGGFGAWFDVTGQVTVQFIPDLSLWRVSSVFFGFFGDKPFGSVPFGSYSRNISCRQTGTSTWGEDSASSFVS